MNSPPDAESPLAAPLRQWLTQARQHVDELPLHAEAVELGRVEAVSDGIAHISGLPSARLSELLHIDGGYLGYALTLDTDRIGCVLLDDAPQLEAGAHVRGSGEVLRVPVGPGLLGRIVDPLGRPLDDGAPIDAERYDPIERPAPTIIERALVTEPVHTGTLAIDAMFPLGRGQRELIIGDRATGKTAIATDALIAQKNSELICVYVAVGQQSAATARVIDAVQRYGAPERTIFVVAAAATAPGLQWVAPFAGMSIAEYFRDRGQHALVVIDDLSKHAATHRELALLTRQPPGREAYPGDVFYLHARLLERAAKLAPERGGGSLTALPIAQTEAGNLSGYIPTNLISITDGQIVLDSKLFNAGHKPAVDTGLSVSRVGGKTQTAVLRQAAESLRLDYAQFLELEMFTRFGTAPDARVQAQITRGQRIRSALNQPQFAVQSAAEQIGLLLALQAGLLDALDDTALAAFRERLHDWLDGTDGRRYAALVEPGAALNEAQRATALSALRGLLGDGAATTTADPS